MFAAFSAPCRAGSPLPDTGYGGGFTRLGRQALAAAVTIAYSGVLTCVIAAVVGKTLGLRVTPEPDPLIAEAVRDSWPRPDDRPLAVGVRVWRLWCRRPVFRVSQGEHGARGIPGARIGTACAMITKTFFIM